MEFYKILDARSVSDTSGRVQLYRVVGLRESS
jgi:hypothetical protein